MAVICLVCEQCGGNVELDDSHEFGFCKFCKAKIIIKNDNIINEITQNITKHVYGYEGKDVDELINDGNKLLEIGDDEKANAKFEQAISIEPNSWNAWFGYATTGGDRTEYISCVPAYIKAYNIATDDTQKMSTFNDMSRCLSDRSLSDALIIEYKSTSNKKRHEMFNLVVGVIGCDDSEIAKLAIDLCPNDWRTWFAQAKIRQIRVKWCETEGGLFTKERLPKDATEVLDIFIRAYQLAKNNCDEAKNIILSHISTMTKDNSYANFTRILNDRIKREG